MNFRGDNSEYKGDDADNLIVRKLSRTDLHTKSRSVGMLTKCIFFACKVFPEIEGGSKNRLLLSLHFVAANWNRQNWDSMIIFPSRQDMEKSTTLLRSAVSHSINWCQGLMLACLSVC